MEIYLEYSQIKSDLYTIQYNIDSFLGFPKSLAFAQQGLEIYLFLHFYINLGTNLYIYIPVRTGRHGRTSKVPIYKVPYYCLGKVLSYEDISVYLFFPRIYNIDKPTNFPGKADSNRVYSLLEDWTDKILIPAITRHYSASTLQHLPTS
jgi:hypothetical protein